ncbi:MAG: D-sedoheptulose-7-phosphate isomerase [Terrimicrobiaceae bacterium]|jgi:D-sedoheptulose 7-phosphate isomerase
MLTDIEIIDNYLDQASTLMLESKSLTSLLDAAGELISRSLMSGGKLMLCGNGGSAADAQHIAAEFVGQFKKPRGPLPAMALTTDSSVLTAIGNDFGFDQVFSRQVEALASAGDVLICYSTSGKSQNVINALAVAKRMALGVIVFSSIKAPVLEDLIELRIPSTSTPHVQQVHITLSHVLCEIVEEKLGRLREVKS